MIDTAMTEALSRFLDVDVARYKLIASNLANIDTPGFRTRDLDFRAELGRASALAEQGEEESESFSLASYGPVVHRVRGLLERPDGNNVSVERESLLLAQNQLRFEVAVAFLKSEFHSMAAAISGGGSTS